MTSLNLPGFSLTLLLLPREPVSASGFESKVTFDKNLFIECFDDNTEAPGWRWSFKGKPEMKVSKVEEKKSKKVEEKESDVKGPKREYIFPTWNTS